MNKRMSPLLLATAISCLLSSCQSNPFFSAGTKGPEQSVEISGHDTSDLKWLAYADPKADANFAIEKHDFKLLALTRKGASFPGIDSKATTLKQRCGYQLMANNRALPEAEKGLSDSKALYQYAATYNRLVAAACQKKVIKTSP